MKTLLSGYSNQAMPNYFSHNHQVWEILLNVQGSGKQYVEDKEYNFYPGFIMCIPPRIFHSKVADNTFKDIYILVDSLPFPSENEVLFFSDDIEKSVESLMFMANRIYCKKDKNYSPILDSLANSIYQILLSWSNKPRNESIELFKNELIKNFADPEFKISDAGKNMYYCTDHFRRRFKADTGVTPITYLNNLRIEHAKQLLMQKCFSGMSVSEISYLTGFNDANYFSRLFKNKVGSTPQEFALTYDISKDTRV